MIWAYIQITLIGFIELFFITLSTKFIQKNKYLLAGIVTIINTYIWKWIILALPNMDKNGTFHVYALTLGIACICAMKFDNNLDKLAKKHGLKLMKHKKAFKKWLKDRQRK